jgi:hypothetical protein
MLGEAEKPRRHVGTLAEPRGHMSIQGCTGSLTWRSTSAVSSSLSSVDSCDTHTIRPYRYIYGTESGRGCHGSMVAPGLSRSSGGAAPSLSSDTRTSPDMQDQIHSCRIRSTGPDLPDQTRRIRPTEPNIQDQTRWIKPNGPDPLDQIHRASHAESDLPLDQTHRIGSLTYDVCVRSARGAECTLSVR